MTSKSNPYVQMRESSSVSGSNCGNLLVGGQQSKAPGRTLTYTPTPLSSLTPLTQLPSLPTSTPPSLPPQGVEVMDAMAGVNFEKLLSEYKVILKKSIIEGMKLNTVTNKAMLIDKHE